MINQQYVGVLFYQSGLTFVHLFNSSKPNCSCLCLPLCQGFSLSALFFFFYFWRGLFPSTGWTITASNYLNLSNKKCYRQLLIAICVYFLRYLAFWLRGELKKKQQRGLGQKRSEHNSTFITYYIIRNFSLLVQLFNIFFFIRGWLSSEWEGWAKNVNCECWKGGDKQVFLLCRRGSKTFWCKSQ